MSTIKDKIKEAALAFGFSSVGFAKAESLPDAPLLDWLNRGYHGTMSWMARDPEARLNPKKILAECETVICVALNYYTPHSTKPSPLHGRISRYAFGKDYHKVLRKKLNALASVIQEIAPEARTKVCVDSTPISEKEWARRAGVGWQGKNSNIITRDFGSWIFLGEILTNLILEPDPPHPDFCGTCNRCLEACPTQAIVKPYVVDSTLCIAYHTIEAKEPAPSEISEKTGEWIFGCDICQDVCPWNSFAKTTQIKEFHPREKTQRPLESWLTMTEEKFAEELAGTPLMRAKQAHMAQNARVALQNLATEGKKLSEKKGFVNAG